jgi:hypothetical protein
MKEGEITGEKQHIQDEDPLSLVLLGNNNSDSKSEKKPVKPKYVKG